MVTRRLRDLFAAEVERRQEFVEELSQELPGIASIVLFGSEARGEAKPGSDTDLFIVVQRKTKRLEEHVSDACLRLGVQHQLDLSWLVTDRKELREWEEEGNGFWLNVLSEGIVLTGTPTRGLMR